MWKLCTLENIPQDVPICNTRTWINNCFITTKVEPVIFCSTDIIIPFGIKKRRNLNSLIALGEEFRSNTEAIFFKKNLSVKPLTIKDLQNNGLRKIDLIDIRRYPIKHKNLIFPDKRRIIKKDNYYYILSLPNSWNKYYSSLKKKFKENIRSSIRKLNNNSKIELIECTTNKWREILHNWKEISKNSWQGMQKKSIIFNEKKMAFLENLLNTSIKGLCLLLFYKNKPIAIRIFFLYKEWGLFYVIEYNQNFKKFRPGHILTLEAIKLCIEKGISYIDFGYGQSPHKKDWLAEAIPLCRIMIPLTYKGYLLTLYQIIRWQIGTLLKHRLSKYIR